MARCPDCNKFVSYEEAEPEVEGVEVEDGIITAQVRIVNTCGECGTELTEFTFDLEIDLNLDEVIKEGDVLYSVDVNTAERNSRTEGKGQRSPMFYGADVEFEVILGPAGGEKRSTIVKWSDDVQASEMESLV